MKIQTQIFIENLIEAPDVAVVSFDVFDTLLFRPGFQPSDLFHLLGSKAAELLGLSDFFTIRSAAEHEMAVVTGRPESYRNLHTLEDIYHHIAKTYNLDPKKCQDLCRFELELERTTLRPRNDVKRLYEKAVSLNKRIIVISDTYFSKPFMEALIAEKGFGEVSALYASNACGGRKDAGDIYAYVLEREGVEGRRILHIGDNLHSDVEMAAAAGIMGVHCPAVIENLLESPQSPWRHVLADRVNLDPGARLLLGLAINAWFAAHPSAGGESVFEDNLRLFGFVGLGPLLFHIAHEIAESGNIQQSYPAVCFASRDGYLPMRAYDLLTEGRKKIPSHYIYCGRAAYDIYRFNGDPAAFMSGKVLRSQGYTLRSLLKYLFEMKDGDLHDTLVNALDKKELDTPYVDSTAAIERICTQYNERISSFFNAERTISSQYYSSEIAKIESNRAIIFDVGYGGSVSRAIGALTGSKIDKIYLKGDDENVDSDRTHGTLTRILMHDPDEVTRDVPGFFILLEELFSPVEGACIGFRREQGKILPILATNDIFGQRMRDDLAAIQESALDFVRVVKETFGALAPCLRVGAANHLMRPVQYGFGRSAECEERIFSNILFSDLFFHNKVRPLSTKVKPYSDFGNLPDRSGFDEPSRVTSSADFASSRSLKAAVHFYLRGAAFLQPVLLAVSQIPTAFDLFITVDDESLRQPVEAMAQAMKAAELDQLTVATARGDSAGSWIATACAHASDYDLLCHFGAISPDGSSELTADWFQHLLEAVLSPSAVSGILSRFAEDRALGLLFPSVYRQAYDTMRMAPGGIVPQSVRVEMDRLLAEMNIKTGYNRSDFFIPIGDAFWCRPAALRPLIGWAGAQPALSGETSAAISRILAVVSAAEGFSSSAFVPNAMLLRAYRAQGQEIETLASVLAHTRQEMNRIASLGAGHAELNLRDAGRILERTVRRFVKAKIRSAKMLPQRLRSATVTGLRGLAALIKIRSLNRFNAKRPVFSVVIPIYNRTWELELAINSILKQSFRNFELILVCDGSPAETLDIVDRYATHPQIRVHKFNDNSGNACRGRNTGISMARGKYVAFMDSDDISAPDRLWHSLFHFLRDRADMIYGSVKIISDGTRNIDGIWDGQFRKSFALSLREMEDVNPAWTSTVAVRRGALVRFGVFRMAMRYREDQELWLRLAYNGCKLYPAPELLAYYRFHQGNAELLFKDKDAHWKELMLTLYKRPYEEPVIAEPVEVPRRIRRKSARNSRVDNVLGRLGLRRQPPPVAAPDVSDVDECRWEESIQNGLAFTKVVVLDEVADIDDVPANPKGERSLLMLIPPPERGSGGRMTMARILRSLSASGLRCHVAFYPEVPDHAFRDCERSWLDEFKFKPDECIVLELKEARQRRFDIAIATFWPSAYVVRRQIHARSKGYLVQDFEPYFYPPGANYGFAEESYRLGLWGICASPWLAKKLSEEYGMKTAGFELGLEKHEYRLIPGATRDPRLVIAYVRQHTERRGYELVMWALKKIKDEAPDVRVEIFGDGSLPPGQFLWIDKNHGILNHDELCQLYNRASIGIVTSFTNYSLIPNEMMACGCAVIDLDTDCTRSVFPEGSISLAAATPQGIAEAVRTLTTDQAALDRQVANGLAYIKNVSWSHSLAEINSAIMAFSGGVCCPPPASVDGDSMLEFG
ncbi:glycosyltransferase [Rhodoblastus acidophilus]|uniref:Glycosyltransferase n=1 Tax=Rhodoblastus acidophilus TaxID=1074 RepID=A0A6N8DRI6_RHOAC|nr:glycosyltransferase [Rhodoblastus acidophilus]MCW2276466.1 glycosyltransferase involved in cell wall biosynthesis/FMN phosphatase YigB (HAD superfamily) [Rhodoblastus acidophilus]MTV33242.1 glycosyltransferase [Rhodoblastus acidophilus]